MVGITNTGHTFPLVFAFITSELKESFKFIQNALDTLVFHSCPGPYKIVRDQTKGLAAAMLAIDKAADEAVATTREGGMRGARPFLQLCKWHAGISESALQTQGGDIPKK